ATLIAAQLAAASLPAGLSELPPQPLPTGECALFLWDRASTRRFAMLGRNPPLLRLMIDGEINDLPVTTTEGAPVLGFAPVSRYRSATRSYEVRLTILPATAGGAVVRDGSMTITEADGSALVLPVAGLAGCP
ncbi:MAG: hypothetical protein ACOYO0_14615, partial [Sandarakinorhabdus sp.]